MFFFSVKDAFIQQYLLYKQKSFSCTFAHMFVGDNINIDLVHQDATRGLIVEAGEIEKSKNQVTIATAFHGPSKHKMLLMQLLLLLMQLWLLQHLYCCHHPAAALVLQRKGS